MERVSIPTNYAIVNDSFPTLSFDYCVTADGRPREQRARMSARSLNYVSAVQTPF